MSRFHLSRKNKLSQIPDFFAQVMTRSERKYDIYIFSFIWHTTDFRLNFDKSEDNIIIVVKM